MPKKTPEPIREKIVEMRSRKPPASYTEIEKETGVSRPTIAGVLKEAGRTRSNKAAPVAPSAPSSPTPSTANTKPGSVEEFLPEKTKTPAKKASQANQKVTHGACSGCGAELTIRGEIGPDDACPECGEALQ